MLFSLLLLGAPAQGPILEMQHTVIRRVDASVLAKHPEGSTTGRGPARGILDETGTYVFTTLARYKLQSGVVAPYRTLVPCSGKKPYPDSYGDMVCTWAVGLGIDLDRYMLQETKKVFHSADGASLWVESSSWKGSSASTFGRIWMSGNRPGFTGYLNCVYASMAIWPAMGTDGKSFAFLRSHRHRVRRTQQPGHVPPVSDAGDVAIGRLGFQKLQTYRVPTKWMGKEGLNMYPYHFDQSRRVLLAQEIRSSNPKGRRVLVATLPSRGEARVRAILPPEDRKVRSILGGEKDFFASNAWLTPATGDVLVQMSAGTDIPAEHSGPLHTLWLYSMKTSTWRKVGDYKVRAWSGSNKLFLIGVDRFDDPAWLIKLEE